MTATLVVSAGAKFAQLDEPTAELATCVRALGLREQRVGQVVEQQVVGQPNHQSIINGASLQLYVKISRVSCLAASFDDAQVAVCRNAVALSRRP